MSSFRRACPYVALSSTSKLGRATRARCAEGELFRLPEVDEPLARRLLAWGSVHLDGFVDGGGDDEGIWLLRRIDGERASSWPKGARASWRAVLDVVRAVAEALATCEKHAVFPGRITGEAIVLVAGDGVPIGAWVDVEPYVATLLGAPPENVEARVTSARWTPPEQLDGARWDGAAHRYVLGLVAYRLLAGDDPFGGAGVRHALEARRAGAPPFVDDVARALRPGVQALVLSMLDGDRDRRPHSAQAIVDRCTALLADEVAKPEGRTPRLPRSRELHVERDAPLAPVAPVDRLEPRTRIQRLGFSMIPVAVGAVIFALAISAGGSSTPAPPPPPKVSAVHAAGASPSDCASCHAGAVAGWERSVMAHAAKSPLFGALESVVEEQVGRDARCPNGAGVLRTLDARDACRDEITGRPLTGTGGEEWCVRCHAPAVNLASSGGRDEVPAWTALGEPRARRPLRDLLPPAAMNGISCATCHATIGPVSPLGSDAFSVYEGNPTWTSPLSGRTFSSRPEDARGTPGISNSGYLLEAAKFFGASDAPPFVHHKPSASSSKYLRSSEFCGACHDVRLFGTDSLAVRERGEHFKRLRDAYSEWRAWSEREASAGRSAAGCVDCHMSVYPGRCANGGAGDADCASGTHFEPTTPGTTSIDGTHPHAFTSVDLPLTPLFPQAFIDDRTLDADGVPVGLRARRDMLLRHTFAFAIGDARRTAQGLEIPIEIENVGAGHRVPAGFSQEREIWVELVVRDGAGAVVYRVGDLGAPSEDLHDKVFARVNVGESIVDARGRPLGLFGADVIDGPDAPRWTPEVTGSTTSFRGQGLINLQNGFLRCVRCIGTIDPEGRCQPAAGQGLTRADRFDDGEYDLDSGECRSNLDAEHSFFETYFPVGALDASRGVAKAPDAIISSRSAPPGVPVTYTYVLDARGRGPFTIEARLRFRAFPPFLVRAFAAYEARLDAEGKRPSGPQVTLSMLERIEPIDLARAKVRVP